MNISDLPKEPFIEYHGHYIIEQAYNWDGSPVYLVRDEKFGNPIVLQGDDLERIRNVLGLLLEGEKVRMSTLPIGTARFVLNATAFDGQFNTIGFGHIDQPLPTTTLSRDQIKQVWRSELLLKIERRVDDLGKTLSRVVLQWQWCDEQGTVLETDEEDERYGERTK